MRPVSLLVLIVSAALFGGCASSPKAQPASETATAEGPGAPAEDARVIEMEVTEEGFVPSPVAVKQGEPVTLEITRKTAKTCATEIMIPDLDIEQELPLNETVSVTFTPQKTGELKYGCGMGQMIGGVIVVE